MSKLPHGSSKLTYRRDIDGLRAVAVLLVLFDHLHTRVSGGFIGVDVFFVISGYLISAGILSEMASGTFSIVAFYERRIRRIFPAMLAVLLATSVLAYLYLIPSELTGYASSLLAALFSVSNFVFWHQGGYFNGNDFVRPLLHTWSLAVEEQFYIFFPLFLVAVRRWSPQRLKIAIWILAAASFVCSCVWLRVDSGADFYLAPFRAWELLVGTILSQNYLPPLRSSWARNLGSLAGILLILVPSFVMSGDSAFPGYNALWPCVGASLIILAGEHGSSVVGSVLSSRPVVFIGLISYSLYLWHWPIIAFQDSNSFLMPNTGRYVKLVIALLSLVIATLSWRFIETPFRKGRLRPARRPLFVMAGGAVAVLSLLGLVFFASRGLPTRFQPEAIALMQRVDPDAEAQQIEAPGCFLTSEGQRFNQAACFPQGSSRPQLLLLGDSHAALLYRSLSAVYPEVEVGQATAADCRPLWHQPAGDRPYCSKIGDFIFGDYLLKHHPDTIVLAGRWRDYEMPALGDTIAWFQQHHLRVVVVGPAIEWDAPLPRVLIFSMRAHDPAQIEQHRSRPPQALDAVMESLAQNTWHVPYISEYRDLCQSGSVPGGSLTCPAYAAPNVPLLFDRDHLGTQGSILFAHSIRQHRQIPLS
jgi:peptidoglycan/LPS O-acetylase OafA/YrhL